MGLLTVLLCIFIAYWFFTRMFPQIFLWWVNRRLRKQMNEIFGQQQNPFYHSAPGAQRRQKPRRGKKIPRDVGEYVEFEEIHTQVEYTAPPRQKFKPEDQITDADWEEIH